MSDDGKPRIRPVSRMTSSVYSQLKQARCFPEIDRRIRLGWSSIDCANAIQNEFNEMKDTSNKYLKKLLDRYRSQIPPAELSVSSSNTIVSRLATKRVAEGLDELAEYEKLYNAQLQRLEIDIANEREGKKLLDTTAQEFHVAMKLLKQSSDLKMDLGLVKRQMGSVEITGQLATDASERYGKDSVGKLITDPDARKKIIGIAEKLLLMSAKVGADPSEIIGTIPNGDGADKPIIDIVDSEV
jgi:hypothetical protein